MSLRSLTGRLDRLEGRRIYGSSENNRQLFPRWLDPALAMVGCDREASPPGSTEWRYDSLPAQRAFHSDLEIRFKGYSGPIGSGKSYALAYEALLLSRLNPGLLELVGAPTYRMLQDSTQRFFFEVLDVEGIAYAFNKQTNHLRFSDNGSEIIFRTMENRGAAAGA
jgi:hypothetical protein